jgi:hypothetical protein
MKCEGLPGGSRGFGGMTGKEFGVAEMTIHLGGRVAAGEGRRQSLDGLVVPAHSYVGNTEGVENGGRLFTGGIGFHQALHGLQGGGWLVQLAIQLGDLPEYGAILRGITQGAEIIGQRVTGLARSAEHAAADHPGSGEFWIEIDCPLGGLPSILGLTGDESHFGQSCQERGILGSQTAGLFHLCDGLLSGVAAPEGLGVVAASLRIDGAGGDGLGQEVLGRLLLAAFQSGDTLAG